MRFSKSLVVLLLAVIATVGCGGGNNNSNAGGSNPTTLSGSWEATLPNVDGQGSTQYVEANISQSGSTVSASQVDTFVLSSNGNEIRWCTPTDIQSLSAALSGTTLSGTITTCWGSATFSGTVANNTSLSGTYTSSGVFSGSGSFSAQTVAALSGTYAGTVNFEDGTQESVSVSLSENSSSSITVSGSVTGVDAGSISLTGSVVGNVAIVSGTVSGQSASLLAWNHAGSIYVIDSSTGFYYGQLFKQ